MATRWSAAEVLPNGEPCESFECSPWPHRKVQRHAALQLQYWARPAPSWAPTPGKWGPAETHRSSGTPEARRACGTPAQQGQRSIRARPGARSRCEVPQVLGSGRHLPAAGRRGRAATLMWVGACGPQRAAWLCPVSAAQHCASASSRKQAALQAPAAACGQLRQRQQPTLKLHSSSTHVLKRTAEDSSSACCASEAPPIACACTQQDTCGAHVLHFPAALRGGRPDGARGHASSRMKHPTGRPGGARGHHAGSPGWSTTGPCCGLA